jgi:hypothetical protein
VTVCVSRSERAVSGIESEGPIDRDRWQPETLKVRLLATGRLLISFEMQVRNSGRMWVTAFAPPHSSRDLVKALSAARAWFALVIQRCALNNRSASTVVLISD